MGSRGLGMARRRLPRERNAAELGRAVPSRRSGRRRASPQPPAAKAPGLQIALGAKGQVALRRTSSQDAHSAQAEIEANGVVGVDPGEETGDLAARPCVGGLSTRGSQIAADPENMRIDRVLKRLGFLDFPETEVDSVIGANDPPEEKIQPLASA